MGNVYDKENVCYVCYVCTSEAKKCTHQRIVLSVFIHKENVRKCQEFGGYEALQENGKYTDGQKAERRPSRLVF